MKTGAIFCHAPGFHPHIARIRHGFGVSAPFAAAPGGKISVRRAPFPVRARPQPVRQGHLPPLPSVARSLAPSPHEHLTDYEISMKEAMRGVQG
jgi:hypothetical protein